MNAADTKRKEIGESKPEQQWVNSAETPPTSNGCKHCIFNYLYPHHTTTPSGCSVSRTLHYLTRPLNRAMGNSEGEDA